MRCRLCVAGTAPYSHIEISHVLSIVCRRNGVCNWTIVFNVSRSCTFFFESLPVSIYVKPIFRTTYWQQFACLGIQSTGTLMPPLGLIFWRVLFYTLMEALARWQGQAMFIWRNTPASGEAETYIPPFCFLAWGGPLKHQNFISGILKRSWWFCINADLNCTISARKL